MEKKQILHRYDVVCQMNQDDNQRVYMCIDTETETTVVVKENIDQIHLYKKIQDSKCKYLPRIIEVIDCKTEMAEEHGKISEEVDEVVAKQCYVVEEYIEGVSLEQWLTNNVCSMDQFEGWILSLMEALQTLHQLDIVHRDIKPQNIMVRNNGDIVLIDYSASRQYKKAALTDTVYLGTKGFAAPEQYGLSQSDARTDMYSLGVLMNILLIQEYPSEKLYEGVYTSVIETCTEINMDKRYPNDEALQKAFLKAKKKRFNQEHKWKIIGTYFLCIFGLIGVVFGLTYYRSEKQRRMEEKTVIENAVEDAMEDTGIAKTDSELIMLDSSEMDINEKTTDIDGDTEEITSESLTTEEPRIEFRYDWDVVYAMVWEKIQNEWPEVELFSSYENCSIDGKDILSLEQEQYRFALPERMVARQYEVEANSVFNTLKELKKSIAIQYYPDYENIRHMHLCMFVSDEKARFELLLEP